MSLRAAAPTAVKHRAYLVFGGLWSIPQHPTQLPCRATKQPTPSHTSTLHSSSAELVLRGCCQQRDLHCLLAALKVAQCKMARCPVTAAKHTARKWLPAPTAAQQTAILQSQQVAAPTAACYTATLLSFTPLAQPSERRSTQPGCCLHGSTWCQTAPSAPGASELRSVCMMFFPDATQKNRMMQLGDWARVCSTRIRSFISAGDCTRAGCPGNQ